MSFLNALHTWHDFYVGTGVVSAALLGFAYLGLFQHGENGNGRGGARSLEGRILGSLFGVLIISLLILIPGESERSLGILLLVASILASLYFGRSVLRGARNGLKSAGPIFLAWQIVFPSLAVLAVLCASLLLLAGARATAEKGLYVLSAALLAFLLIAARDSWALLGHSGQDRLKLRRRG